VPDHPVRSIKGGFATSFLMSRPPLLYQDLYQEGISAPRPEARDYLTVLQSTRYRQKMFSTKFRLFRQPSIDDGCGIIRATQTAAFKTNNERRKPLWQSLSKQ
jgi:hypothetical protein